MRKDLLVLIFNFPEDLGTSHDNYEMEVICSAVAGRSFSSCELTTGKALRWKIGKWEIKVSDLHDDTLFPVPTFLFFLQPHPHE